jgi:hypothetical protein
MTKNLLRVAALIPLGLLAWAFYLVLSSPPEPAFNAPDKAAVVDQLNHIFLSAAYSITWAIQLGYLVWLGFKWQAQKQNAAHPRRSLR